MAEEPARRPEAIVETFATDEHRIGLKPITRRVWAPRGARPVAPCHHRFEWLYVTACVSPATGESFWYLSTGVDKGLFEATLALFARAAGAGRDPRHHPRARRRRLAHRPRPRCAGGHPARRSFSGNPSTGRFSCSSTPYTPQLQPAEPLWVHVNEPIANKHFDTVADLDAAVAAQCVALNADRNRIRGQAFTGGPLASYRRDQPEVV